MGGVVGHSSNLPDPVALFSAEAEHNEACFACMSTAHLCKFLVKLELSSNVENKTVKPVPMMIENRSAVGMGVSYKAIKHISYIMRCYCYVQEGVESKQHILIWSPTESQLADIGTKPLAQSKFEPMMKYTMVKINDEYDGSIQERCQSPAKCRAV